VLDNVPFDSQDLQPVEFDLDDACFVVGMDVVTQVDPSYANSLLSLFHQLRKKGILPV
jgi:hypothetical protein